MDHWSLTAGARWHVAALVIFSYWVGAAQLLTPARYATPVYLQAQELAPIQAFGAARLALGTAILALYLLGCRRALFWALITSGAYGFAWMGLALESASTNSVASWSGGAFFFYPAASAVGLAFVMLPSRRTRQAVKRAEALLREEGVW